MRSGPSAESRQRVLVVDDEPQVIGALTSVLATRGYRVTTAMNGTDAIAAVAAESPDMIVLDLMLPDMTGFEVLEAIRPSVATPVLVLTVLDKEADKIKALDLGADDYMTKPFAAGELLARIRALLRRGAMQDMPQGGVIEAGTIVIDSDTRVVTVDGREVRLTRKEFDLLRYMALNTGSVLTYAAIIRGVWGPGASADPQVLRVHVSNLRKKIEAEPAVPKHLVTEPGVGFRLMG